MICIQSNFAMNDIEIFLVIVAVFLGSFVIVSGLTYIIVAHCGKDENRFKWLPYGQKYQQCCGIRTEPPILLSTDMFYGNYSIDIDDIKMTDKDLFSSPKQLEEYDFL